MSRSDAAELLAALWFILATQTPGWWSLLPSAVGVLAIARAVVLAYLDGK